MDNKFCKDCVHFVNAIHHCSYGFQEFRLASPTSCVVYQQEYEDKSVGKKTIICNSCLNKSSYGNGRAFCSKNVIFFNDKKSESCRLYRPKLTEDVGKSVIALPEKSNIKHIPPPKTYFKKKIKEESTEFWYSRMVE